METVAKLRAQYRRSLEGLQIYAYGHEFEVKAKITKAPKATLIEDLQNGSLEAKD